MKIKTLALTAATALSLGAGAQAYTISLQGDILLNGVSDSGGTALSDAAGLLRYGYFQTFDAAAIAANSGNIGALELDFAEVARTDTFFPGFDGFSSETFELVADGADTSSYINNVGGNQVMLWAFNANTTGGASQHGIFATNILFASGVDDTNNQTAFSIDDGTPGLTAIIGTLGTGPDLGGGAASHQLEAIPEPVASLLLTLSGLGLILRRRR